MIDFENESFVLIGFNRDEAMLIRIDQNIAFVDKVAVASGEFLQRNPPGFRQT